MCIFLLACIILIPCIYKPLLAVAAPHSIHQNHSFDQYVAGSCKYIYGSPCRQAAAGLRRPCGGGAVGADGGAVGDQRRRDVRAGAELLDPVHQLRHGAGQRAPGGLLLRREQPERGRQQHRRPAGHLQVPEADHQHHAGAQARHRRRHPQQVRRRHPIPNRTLNRLLQVTILLYIIYNHFYQLPPCILDDRLDICRVQ